MDFCRLGCKVWLSNCFQSLGLIKGFSTARSLSHASCTSMNNNSVPPELQGQQLSVNTVTATGTAHHWKRQVERKKRKCKEMQFGQRKLEQRRGKTSNHQQLECHNMLTLPMRNIERFTDLRHRRWDRLCHLDFFLFEFFAGAGSDLVSAAF